MVKKELKPVKSVNTFTLFLSPLTDNFYQVFDTIFGTTNQEELSQRQFAQELSDTNPKMFLVSKLTGWQRTWE